MEIIKRYRFFLILFVGFLILLGFQQTTAFEAIKITGNSLVSMLMLLPPILIFVGLLDTWVSQETIMKYMGEDSKFLSVFLIFLLGSIAAGPLYVAFPIALLLLEKGVRVQLVVFFLGVWVVAKLPIILYETVALGLLFTIIHISFGLVFFYLLGFYIEKKIAGQLPILKNEESLMKHG